MLSDDPVIEATHKLAASDVPESRWGEVVSQSLLSFDYEFEQPDAFRGRVHSHAFADIEFIEISCASHVAFRDAAAIEDVSNSEYLMTLQLSGEFRITQEGRSASLRPGDFAFYDSARPVLLESSNDYRSLGIKFPQELLVAPREDLSDMTATRIDSQTGLAPAVWALLSSLNQTGAGIAGACRFSTVRSVMDLVTTMLHGQTRVNEAPRSIDAHANLLRSIFSYMDEHLGDPDLSPQEIAAVHFISRRHLHNLFEDSGSTVAAWIRARRLERCRRDLSDPLQAHLPISAIATRWGFKGASPFGHIFKTAAGQTPSEFRRQMLNSSFNG